MKDRELLFRYEIEAEGRRCRSCIYMSWPAHFPQPSPPRCNLLRINLALDPDGWPVRDKLCKAAERLAKKLLEVTSC